MADHFWFQNLIFPHFSGSAKCTFFKGIWGENFGSKMVRLMGRPHLVTNNWLISINHSQMYFQPTEEEAAETPIGLEGFKERSCAALDKALDPSGKELTNS